MIESVAVEVGAAATGSVDESVAVLLSVLLLGEAVTTGWTVVVTVEPATPADHGH